jgi:hypothetical protein
MGHEIKINVSPWILIELCSCFFYCIAMIKPYL